MQTIRQRGIRGWLRLQRVLFKDIIVMMLSVCASLILPARRCITSRWVIDKENVGAGTERKNRFVLQWYSNE